MSDDKQNFGFPKREGYGRVYAGIHMSSKEDHESLSRAIEAGLRQFPADERLQKWRTQLLNMRNKAYREDWVGWS
jgi:hypothetical protein